MESFPLSIGRQNSSLIVKNVLPSFLNYIPQNDPLFNQESINIIITDSFLISEKCPICLNRLKKFIKLDNCGHLFCKKCILK